MYDSRTIERLFTGTPLSVKRLCQSFIVYFREVEYEIPGYHYDCLTVDIGSIPVGGCLMYK